MFTLDSSTSSVAMQNKTVPRRVASADGGVFWRWRVSGAGAIARCGAQWALACATGRWGPCRTSRSAPTGCPRSRGCPTGDASGTLSGRPREFRRALGVLEREGEGRELLFADDLAVMMIMANKITKKVNRQFHKNKTVDKLKLKYEWFCQENREQNKVNKLN